MDGGSEEKNNGRMVGKRNEGKEREAWKETAERSLSERGRERERERD